MKKYLFFSIAAFVMNTAVIAQSNSEVSTSEYFEKIKNNPSQLFSFLQTMPKGGDLHNHHGGAAMAENMLHYAVPDSLCIDETTFTIAKNPACASKDLLEHIQPDSSLYNAIIDAWSMRKFHPGKESGHDHFFATFGKYYSIVDHHSSEILAEIVKRAGQQNELYLELFMTTENQAVSKLANRIGWDPNLSALRKKLLHGGLDRLVINISKNIESDDRKLKKALACDTLNPHQGCDVKVRYIYLALREQPPVQVFAQLLAGFEAANKNSKILGVNLVQPEDGAISMHDYKLHMQMVGFLHNLYPHAHITLHAGELNHEVSPENLSFHIREAINVGHAERIGHGVDVASEQNADQLLKTMAKRRVLVEINLSSNATILGVKGDSHPLPLYLHYHVPVALSTDDEGVLRTNLTEQYQIAVLTYHFSYPILKNLVRNSITYSFLPGKDLWEDGNYSRVVPVCLKDALKAEIISPSCKQFLNKSEKASLQWELEKRFVKFEEKYALLVTTA